MKKVNRILSVLIAFALLIGSAGCNKTNKSENESPSQSIDGKVSFPLEKQIEVSVIAKLKGGYANTGDSVVAKKIEEETNIKVKWTHYSDSIYNEKINLAFSTGTLPDALFGSYIIGVGDVVKHGEDKAIVPLNKYIDAGIMPNFCKSFELRPQIKKDLTTPDGNIYYVPIINEETKEQKTQSVFLINQKWLKAVNKEIPKTTDELYDVLKAFKNAGDLNGNGDDDEIPMSFILNNGIFGLDNVAGWFGTPTVNGRLPAIVNNKVIFPFISDDYKETLRFLNKLYSEQLLDQEAFTTNVPAYKAKMTSKPARLGVIPCWSTYSIAGGDMDDYVYMSPLTSPTGKKPKVVPAVFSNNKQPSFVITSKCKYPKEMAAWIDIWIDPDTLPDYRGGGPDYIKKNENGKYERIPLSNGQTPQGVDMTWYSPADNTPGIMLMPEYMEWEKIDDLLKAKIDANKYYEPYFTEQNMGTWFTTEDEARELSQLKTDYETYLDQSVANFITKGNIDEKWNQYVAQLKKLGLTRATEIYQVIFDRNK